MADKTTNCTELMLQRGHPPPPLGVPAASPSPCSPLPLLTPPPTPLHPTPVLPGDRPGQGSRRETRSGPSDTHLEGDLGATDGKRDKSPPQTAVATKVTC